MTSTEAPHQKASDNVSYIRAQFLRVGWQVLTEDGWQTINGLVIFADADQVTVHTSQRDDVWTSGWRFTFNQIVETRSGGPATGCPEWCVEHYDGGERMQQRNHASFPQSVNVANTYTGEPVEMGIWLERRDCGETGSSETVGILEVGKIVEDIELTPDQMRRLAAKLRNLADRAEGRPHPGSDKIENPSPPPEAA